MQDILKVVKWGVIVYAVGFLLTFIVMFLGLVFLSGNSVGDAASSALYSAVLWPLTLLMALIFGLAALQPK